MDETNTYVHPRTKVRGCRTCKRYTNYQSRKRKDPNWQQWHRLSSIDETARQAICSICGPVAIKPRLSPSGHNGWTCAVRKARTSHRANRAKQKPYRKYLADSCARCGFVPEDRRQMDVHHLNGDHSDNDPSNLETLCANCHRLQH